MVICSQAFSSHLQIPVRPEMARAALSRQYWQIATSSSSQLN